MNQNILENIIKDRLYHAEEQAPDVLGNIFEKRNAWHVMSNRLVIHRYKWLSASAVVIALLSILWWTNRPTIEITESNQNPIDSNSGIENNKVEQGQIITSETPAPSEESEFIQEKNLVDHSAGKSQSGLNSQSGFVKANKTAENPNSNTTGRKIVQKSQSGNSGEIASGENGNDLNNSNKDPKAIGSNPDKSIISNDNEVEGEKNLAKSESTAEKGDDVKEGLSKSDQTSDNTNKSTIAKNDDLEENQLSSPGDDPLPKSSPIKKWSLSARFGPTWGNRSLSGSQQDWISLRNKTESPMISTQAFVLFNRELNQNWEGYVGVSVINRKEKVTFTHNYNQQDMQVNSHQVVKYDPILPPKTVTIFDTTYTTSEISEENTWENTYQYISIPIGVRYTKYLGEKVGLYLSGDAQIVVANQYSGRVLNPDMTEMNISGSQYQRSQMGFACSFAPGFNYALSPRISALFEPRGTLFINPVNQTRYELKQQDWGFSALIGLKYHF